MKLEEYYRTLLAFLRENTLLYRVGGEEQKRKPRALDPALMPLTAFLLASKQCVYERVDQLYAEILKKPDAFMNLDGAYENVHVPELESCLTLPGRVAYRKLLLLFLVWKGERQVLRLIKMAYPLSYTEEDGKDLEATLLVGDYDVRNAAVTYLALYLRGIAIPSANEKDPASLVYQQFEQAYLLNVPLPFWLPQENTEQDSAAFRLSDLINAQYISACEPWYVDVYQSVTKLKSQAEMNKKSRSCPIQVAAPPALGLLTEYEQTAAVTSAIVKKGGNPNIEKRLRKEGGGESGILPFLYEILSNAYLSREELLDSCIPEDMNDWVNQAIFKAKAAGAGLPLEEYQILAGVFYALLNRVRHAEELAGLLLMKDSSATVRGQQETDKKTREELASLKQELSAANRRNGELNKTLVELKQKTDKELRQKSCDYNGLNRKYKNLKHDFEQLIMVKDDAEGYEPSADGITLEEMKEEIRKKKLLFVGGHPSWQNALKSEFPEFRFLDPKEYTAATPAVFVGIDFIIYNVNWNNHGMYYKCLKHKDSGSRFVFIRSNNMKRTILDIYGQIKAGDVTDVVE